MADEEQVPFASIIDNCRYSSSQEELLSHSKFAREDETFPDDEKPPETAESSGARRNLDGAVDFGGIHGGEFTATAADSAREKNLGFQGERKGPSEGEASGAKLAELTEGKSEIEPQLKKSKVDSVIHYSGKMVIEGGNEEEVVVVKGDLVLQTASASGSVVQKCADCTEKLDSEVGEDDPRVEGEVSSEGGGKKKVETCLETEVIDGEEEEEKGEKCEVDKKGNDHGEGSGKIKENKKEGEDTSKNEEDNTRKGKRELPPSMFGLVWDAGTGDINRNENKVIENGNMEDDTKEASVEVIENGNMEDDTKEASVEVIENGNMEDDIKEASVADKREEEPKGGEEEEEEEEEEEAMRSILDVLRVIVGDKCSNDDTEIDIFETAKRRGMTFPRSRFLPEVDEE